METEQRSGLTVPFVDLTVVHDGLKEEVLADISDLIDSGAFTNGPQVEAFEAAFARYCGTSHAVGVASGLDGLRLALLAAGIGPGDEVIVPAHTFIATFEAVTQVGATPVVVDISDDDYNMEPGLVEAAISLRSRSLLPVHLYGQMTDMQALLEIAVRRRLAIVEDACQAHGAERDGLRAGAGGDVGVFSFYPAKNLGAIGDAGAVVTNDESLAAKVRVLREHGQSGKYTHDVEGYTARLDTVQAAVLLHKLPRLDGWNEQRRAAASYYSDALEGIGDLVLPRVPSGSDPVWHLFVVRTADPVQLARFLAERGIMTGRHYPQPPHLSPAYAYLGYRRGDFPVSEALAEEGLSIPLYPGISEKQLAWVAAAIRAYFRGV